MTSSVSHDTQGKNNRHSVTPSASGLFVLTTSLSATTYHCYSNINILPNYKRNSAFKWENICTIAALSGTISEVRLFWCNLVSSLLLHTNL